jgi:twitching motility two-component system response regulator PilG
MQGTLNEIDIRSILQLIELGQRTGELFVEAYSAPPRFVEGEVYPEETVEQTERAELAKQFWFVFFVNGQIVYAADQTNTSLLRLRDYLRRYKAEVAINHRQISGISTTNLPEYAYIWLLLEKNVLTPSQGRSIIESMVQETLFDLLGLHQGGFIFEGGTALAPQLINLEIGPLVTKTMKQIQQWKEFYPHIQHPNQYIVITDESCLRNAVPAPVYQSLLHWMQEKSSLRQLSRYLNRELLAIARTLYPYAERGWIQLVNDLPLSGGEELSSWEFKEMGKKRHIVCIDDDISVGKNIEQILQQNGYESTAISQPLEALGQVFQIKPDIILCDLVMPKLDGYEICAMLRHSSAFRQTPIIMLTGKEGFIDRVRARMVGATDYLTKPFGASELLMLLEKYRNG